MKKLSFCHLFLLILFPAILFSQQYKTALGFRFGKEKGISLQQSLGNKITIESIFSTTSKEDQYNLTLILEKHINFISRRLNMYVGVGPQATFFRNDKLFQTNAISVNTIAGLELNLGRLNCSVDVKPLIHITNVNNLSLIDYQYGLSFRYILIKRDNFWKRAKKKIASTT